MRAVLLIGARFDRVVTIVMGAGLDISCTRKGGSMIGIVCGFILGGVGS